MKKSSAFVVLLAAAFSFQSFKTAETPQAPITAQVAGHSFVLAGNAYTAQLTGTKTAVLTFTGTDLKSADGSAQPQKINVEYKLNEVGDILVKGISYELDGKKFQNVPEATTMNVTKFEWSSDKKSFVISASFDCQAQSAGAFQSNDDAIAIQGKIENVTVSVPASAFAAISE